MKNMTISVEMEKTKGKLILTLYNEKIIIPIKIE